MPETESLPKEQETESTLKDQLDMVIGLVTRRRWYILSLAVVTVVAVVVVLYQLPNRYTSEATLFVVEQQVPQRYVTPTSTTVLVDALPAMTQEVLSRSRLLEIVEQFDLYAQQRKRLAPEEVDSLIRRDINIEPLPPAAGHTSSNAFKISFTTSKAMLAQEVTSKLTSLFIQENLRTREDQARNTTGFLRDRVEIARQKLAHQEELLREFKTKYLGELPEQQQGNLAILGSANMQLQNIASSLERAQQQRAYIESLLSGYQRLKNRGKAIPSTPGVVGPEPAPGASPYEFAEAELTRLKAKKATLLVDLSPKHPDVLAIDREIAAKQAVADKLKREPPAQTKPAPVPQTSAAAPPIDSEEDTSIAQLRSQLESNSVEIANLAKDEGRQKDIITEYQNRLNLTPVREQELTGILRDYELSKTDYADLLGKEQQSELAMSLEKQQAGQQFRLVDPPSLPALPSSPKRLKMSFSAVAGGLFLGLVAAILVEMKNSAIYSEREVTRRFSIPLVVGLPLLVSRRDKRRRTWTRLFEWCAGTVVVVAILIAEAWVYRHP